MSKRNYRSDEELRFGRCEICSYEIPIEFYCDKGDSVFCSNCSSEHMIVSRRPLRLRLDEENYYDDFVADLDFI